MSAATNSKHRPVEAPEDPSDVASPRNLEPTFEEEKPANGKGDNPRPQPSSSSGGASADEEGKGKSSGDLAPKAAGMLTTLFSPVYQLFAGARDDVAKPGTHRGVDAEAEGDGPGGVTDAQEDGHVQTLPPVGPASAAGNSTGGEAAPASDEEGEEGDDDFDPYLFISTLPPLISCVPEKRNPVLPRKARGSPKVTLVLDLDETLVHSTLDDLPSSDFSFPVHFHNQTHTVNVRRRPHLDAFMEHVGARFEVVIFTASQRVYAERLLDIIDPENKYFSHRIFRDSCVYVDGNYLKDLTVLGRDLAKTVIVDNSPQAFGFQIDNGIPIESWFDDPADLELKLLLPFLDTLVAAKDVRPAIKSHFRLADKVKRAAELANAMGLA